VRAGSRCPVGRSASSSAAPAGSWSGSSVHVGPTKQKQEEHDHAQDSHGKLVFGEDPTHLPEILGRHRLAASGTSTSCSDTGPARMNSPCPMAGRLGLDVVEDRSNCRRGWVISRAPEPDAGSATVEDVRQQRAEDRGDGDHQCGASTTGMSTLRAAARSAVPCPGNEHVLHDERTAHDGRQRQSRRVRIG